MYNNNDLGDMKSRDVGNLTTKNLIAQAKQKLENVSTAGAVDYGDLPSRALTDIGKQVLQQSGK